ncbi:outer membrane porin GjpA [Mycobacterium sp. M1]|uniref:Outer membrane porin GjpA n=1 Tax=Mycolicibacter acidiphilus TaxID=2835306 RepID=A0ABS5RP23_9MYCO|nr:outer membrane porin GjpA [Mycolicibacter acidiphilus]MBS9536056.1 outer membrane porin GjpA [Mycolicibacter acidiphilus]
MQTALKPYATAGVALIGATFLAVTPVSAPAPGPSALRDVALAAGGSPFGDFLAPWLAQYNTAAENATVLANNFYLAPGVGLQQMIANATDYAQQLADDPTKLAAITLEMQENVKAVNDAWTLMNAGPDTMDATTLHTVDASDLSTLSFGHDLILQLLPQFLPADVDPAMVTPIVNFLASPASAMIMGMLGPGLSPWVALMNSINDGDGFNEIMANMFGAYFNGATLNLDSLLPLIADTGFLPEGTTLTHLEFALGGLFSTGSVGQADYELFDSSGNVVNSVQAVGGSMFNALGVSLQTSILPGFTIELAGQPVGPIAAWEAWSQTVAGLLDGGKGVSPWAWDGKSGGTPPPALPPLSGGSLPLIPADTFDDGGASGSAEAPDFSVAEIAEAFGVHL